ncbi:MAG TPA: BTAD domain-containing putative transcriptional regulator [Methylomirabilota bacterium]|jgi:two-component SAPR family response regulator|nr:BTAD domain-containing putative transcriptional regulator [Methylomirabilota bacterium]
MALGRDGGYVTTAWWRPGMMAELCARALAAGIEPEYVRELVRRRRLVPDQPPLDVPEWPWPLRVHTLGGFRLEKDGRPVEFTGKAQRKPMAMLEAIVAFGGRGVHEPQLAEALWPDAEGDAAHQAFATTLHRLRRLVGQDDTVALREGRVSLDSRRCWVDVWAFEALLDQADAEKAGNAARARTLGERALALYRGPFLGPDSPAWAVAARERLRRRFLRGVGRLGRHSEDAGEWRPAIEWYEKGLEVDELAEEFYQPDLVLRELDRGSSGLSRPGLRLQRHGPGDLQPERV